MTLSSVTVFGLCKLGMISSESEIQAIGKNQFEIWKFDAELAKNKEIKKKRGQSKGGDDSDRTDRVYELRKMIEKNIK